MDSTGESGDISKSTGTTGTGNTETKSPLNNTSNPILTQDLV